ncbi:MAG TPA: DUF2382 domain-containing protein [Trichocoleus sp.]
MALVKAKDFYSNYSDAADDKSDITNFDVYAQGNDKVGSVKDILVDEAEGRIRYLIVDTGTWVFGKKVLLPIGQAQLDYTNKRVIARSLTKEQVENLPNVDDSLDKIDEEHEDQVRGIYRSDRNIGATAATTGAAAGTTAAAFDRSSSRYDQDPDLYNMSDRDHQNLKLYEERLVAHKQRQKTGEVTIGKHVETSTVGVDVPLEKERVVIERTPVNQPAANASADAFKEGEVERVEVYEDTPDIRKETFVREEVQLRKEVDQEVATTNETVRREELDINTEGRPSIDR